MYVLSVVVDYLKIDELELVVPVEGVDRILEEQVTGPNLVELFFRYFQPDGVEFLELDAYCMVP